jgi:hypothetical protein
MTPDEVFGSHNRCVPALSECAHERVFLPSPFLAKGNRKGSKTLKGWEEASCCATGYSREEQRR